MTSNTGTSFTKGTGMTIDVQVHVCNILGRCKPRTELRESEGRVHTEHGR